MKKANWCRIVSDDGHEIELISYSKKDRLVITGPPDHSDTIDKIIETLKGTGISKITITFLDDNV